MEKLLQSEEAEFKSYVAGFLEGNPALAPMYRLKLEHSLNVLDCAREIAAAESGLGLSAKLAPLLLPAALYHDLGRFEQLERFGTFRDAESINHAVLGARLLGGSRFLRGLGQRERGLVRLAVLLHNRRQLPEKLAPGLAPLCQALREADQLDILGIMRRELQPGNTPDPTVTLGLADQAESYSPALLEKALRGESINYGDMRYVNDFRLLLCTWPGQMRFAASRRILARRGHMEALLAGLPRTLALARLQDKVREALESGAQNPPLP